MLHILLLKCNYFSTWSDDWFIRHSIQSHSLYMYLYRIVSSYLLTILVWCVFIQKKLFYKALNVMWMCCVNIAVRVSVFLFFSNLQWARIWKNTQIQIFVLFVWVCDDVFSVIIEADGMHWLFGAYSGKKWDQNEAKINQK